MPIETLPAEPVLCSGACHSAGACWFRKECECVTHDCPHWVHLDDIDRGTSKRLLEAGNLAGYARNELRRLAEKERAMIAAGVEDMMKCPAYRHWRETQQVTP